MTAPTLTQDQKLPVSQQWQALRARLEAERQRIQQEISSYPPPIAGCDQQFNFLLEQRTAARREWNRLLALEKASAQAENAQALLDTFIASSVFLSAAARATPTGG